ncbi:MerR family transcriptional regulator [Nocardioides kribbensis]|uniref:MerR family transcriptional regulator n=1 Tax=Nocardioides kribbensis TaxID=305517 RepID=A0ABV1NT74_9ACTN
MRIAEAAARAAIPATTLRYYETVGLLRPGREANGYRNYDEAALARLAFIETAKHLDLSLPEIAVLLPVVEAETCTQVRDAVHPRLLDRLGEVDRHLAALVSLRARLVAATRQVAACPDSNRTCRSECAMVAEGGLTPA